MFTGWTHVQASVGRASGWGLVSRVGGMQGGDVADGGQGQGITWWMTSRGPGMGSGGERVTGSGHRGLVGGSWVLAVGLWFRGGLQTWEGDWQEQGQGLVMKRPEGSLDLRTEYSMELRLTTAP